MEPSHQASVDERLGAAMLLREELIEALAELDDDIAYLRGLAASEQPKRRGKGSRLDVREARLAAADLGEFTISELAKKLRCSRPCAERAVELLDGEYVRFDRLRALGPGRPAKVYVYCKPRPEGLVAQVQKAGPRFARRAVHAPSGQRVKVTNKDLHALIGKASREGFEVSRTNGGHIRLSRDGDATPVIVPNTPSDHRSVDNTRAELRRAGVTV